MFHGRELQPRGKVSAKDYNEIRRRSMNQDETKRTPQSHHTPNPVIVRVRNMTDDTLPEFSVVGLKTPMYKKDSKEDFNNQGTAYGVELEARPWDSDANDHEQQDFGIITRKLAPDSLGYAVIAGPSPVQITHYDPAYPYALPQHNTTGSMRAMPFGPAKIIWIDTGEDSSSGSGSESGSSSGSSSDSSAACDPTPRNAYIDIQNQQWWQFFELQEDLPACGSADAIACYHCGGQIGPCEIHRTIWLPKLGCETDDIKVPAGTIVLAHWFEQENKWIAIDWQNSCPDFDDFEPSDSDLINIDTPVEFEYIVGEDPCVDGCDINLIFNRKTLYHNNCGALCEYDTGSVRIPFNPPTFPSWIPVTCVVDNNYGGSESSSSYGDDSSSSDSCPCDSRRYVHIVYPEIQIGCGALCWTGNTIVAPGCDISLTQDTRLTLYDNQFSVSEGSPCDSSSDSGSDSDACYHCSTLTITRRKKDVRIVCDEWCESEETPDEEVTIPVVACDGGSITYVDNVHLDAGDECGCLSLVIDYATAELHCGAVCSPTITQSEPLEVCLGGDTTDVEVVTGVTGTISVEGNSKTVISDVALDLSNLTLTGDNTTVVTGVSFDATKLALSGSSQTTIVTGVSYSSPTLSTSTASVPNVTGVSLNTSKLTLTGSNQTIVTGASLTPVTGKIDWDYDKTPLASVSLDSSKMSVSVPLTLVTGGFVSGTLRISIPMVKKTVVTDISVNHCVITGTTEDVWCLNPTNASSGASSLDIDVSVSGLTFTPTTTTADHAGTVSLASGYLSTSTVTVKQPKEDLLITGGVLTVSDTTVAIPTGINAQSGAVSLQTGTAITALTSASLSGGGVTPTTDTVTIPTSITASQTPILTTTATILAPTGLSGTGGITKTTTTVCDAGSATFTATTTKRTLSFNHGVLCGGDDSSSSSGGAE